MTSAESTLREPIAPKAETGQHAGLGLDAFSPLDWGLLASCALMWGSSFLLIEEGLESLEPALISLIRLVFGMGTLVWIRAARAPIDRSAWRSIIPLGFLWMAAPFILFPVAQQWIDSSLAGMINGGVPIFAAIVAAIIVKQLPRPRQMLGIVVGFGGVVAVSWPAIQGARSSALGVALVLVATASYGIALNIAAPLQRRYGSLPVLLRVQAVALVMVLIPGLLAIPNSSFKWSSMLAMVPLGCLGTGLAFLAMTTLVGRVGPARGSIAVYFVPVVAIVLGALILDESIAAISLVGTALALVGAWLVSRKVQAPKTLDPS